MDAIRAVDLRKTYGEVRALDGLDLTVPEGSVFGFLGPNGAGKTTTMRILAGLARPDSGTATVAGVDSLRNRAALPRAIGYLPEEPAFPEWLTAREFLDHVGSLFSLSAAERRRRSVELLDQSGLSEASGRRIGGFSRGMRQRLGLAQALVNRPAVLLLDEPASALDPSGRREVLSFVDRLRGSATVFLSTHILADVDRVSDHIGIVNRGRLVRAAGKEELLREHAAPVIEIETVPAAADRLAELVTVLGSEPWIASAEADGPSARITPRDPDRAKLEIPAALVAREIPLVRFEVVAPDLEDVFLRLVSEDGG